MESKIRISLAAARVNAGMSQYEAAHTLHISNKTLINWEKGKSKPSFSSLTVLSQIYNIPVDYIDI